MCQPRENCQDDQTWQCQETGFTYLNCEYFAQNDPGCTTIHDYGQKAACPETCNRCEDCCTADGSCYFGVSYADGSGIQGGLIRDQFIIGTHQAEVSVGLFTSWNPKTNSFSGGSAHQDFFRPNPVDGIFGLGFSSRNCQPTCQDSAVDTFVSANGLPNVFALCLKSTGVGVQHSSLDIGFVDQHKYSGTLHYVPLLSEDEFFIAGPTAVRVGGNVVAVQSAQWGSMIVDSGATLMYVPQPVHDAMQSTFAVHYPEYVGLWSAAGGCITVACDLDIDTLPPFQMDFQDERSATFTLNYEARSYLWWRSPTMICSNIKRASPVPGLACDWQSWAQIGRIRRI